MHFINDIDISAQLSKTSFLSWTVHLFKFGMENVYYMYSSNFIGTRMIQMEENSLLERQTRLTSEESLLLLPSSRTLCCGHSTSKGNPPLDWFTHSFHFKLSFNRKSLHISRKQFLTLYRQLSNLDTTLSSHFPQNNISTLEDIFNLEKSLILGPFRVAYLPSLYYETWCPPTLPSNMRVGWMAGVTKSGWKINWKTMKS